MFSDLPQVFFTGNSQIYHNSAAFVALDAVNGLARCWGHASFGGGPTFRLSEQEELFGVLRFREGFLGLRIWGFRVCACVVSYAYGGVGSIICADVCFTLLCLGRTGWNDGVCEAP